ncbi:hypothetical protein GHT06_014679 [Daphnia sinensis]|uniref:Uncharacterized protein n=1 Tax=Daphnia sinensis TaxID=1820382 RepID=A0AAD5PSL5_9CRUS|nr:hypothetical protein GHT06_014679 [Daphnia sinensis]
MVILCLAGESPLSFISDLVKGREAWTVEGNVVTAMLLRSSFTPAAFDSRYSCHRKWTGTALLR